MCCGYALLLRIQQLGKRIVSDYVSGCRGKGGERREVGVVLHLGGYQCKKYEGPEEGCSGNNGGTHGGL